MVQEYHKCATAASVCFNSGPRSGGEETASLVSSSLATLSSGSLTSASVGQRPDSDYDGLGTSEEIAQSLVSVC